MIYGDKTNDTHCRGWLLFSVVRDGAFRACRDGHAPGDPSIQPTQHIFVGSKAPWFTITDDCRGTRNA